MANVVKIRVYADGEDFIELSVATTETPWDIHEIICDAMKQRPMLVGAYSPGQESHPITLLDFVLLDPFKDWKPPTPRTLDVGYRALLTCQSCLHQRDADLQTLINTGQVTCRCSSSAGRVHSAVTSASA